MPSKSSLTSARAGARICPISSRRPHGFSGLWWSPRLPPYKGRVAVMMSADRFEELVMDALDSIPDGLMRMLDNVVVLVEDDAPSGDPGLLGLYEGYALTARGTDYAGVLPDRITIFRNPILGI